MPRVVVLGSINTDLTLPLRALPAPGETAMGGDLRKDHGGKGANQAVAASRAGAAVTFLAAVGDDENGREALDHYRREGIDVAHVRVIPGASSGAALIFVAEEGENMIGVSPGANALLTPDDIDNLPAALFKPGDLFLAGLESPAATVARGIERAHEAGMRVILNPAPADRWWLRGGLLKLVDILTPNRIEAELLSGLPIDGPDAATRAAEALMSVGPGTVVITLGTQGYVAATATGSFRGPAFPVKAVDTVGAGDAFNGSLATALARDFPLADALRWASAAAAMAVTRPGAQAGLPVLEEIEGLFRP